MSLHRIIIIIMIMPIFVLNIKMFLTYIGGQGGQLVVCKVWYSMVYSICLPVFPVFLGDCIVECGTDKVFGKS